MGERSTLRLKENLNHRRGEENVHTPTRAPLAVIHMAPQTRHCPQGHARNIKRIPITIQNNQMRKVKIEAPLITESMKRRVAHFQKKPSRAMTRDPRSVCLAMKNRVLDTKVKHPKSLSSRKGKGQVLDGETWKKVTNLARVSNLSVILLGQR